MRIQNKPRHGLSGRSVVRIDFFLFALLSLGLTACGGEEGQVDQEQPPSQPTVRAPAGEATGYQVVPVPDGGSIAGTITLAGTPPPPRTVSISDDAEACGASTQISDYVVGAAGGLADVVVSLTDITSGAALEVPGEAPILDQKDCRFTPHVVLVPVGTELAILNSDPVAHNVHTVTFDNRPFNRTQPASLEKIEASFDMAEKVGVKCDIHGWMNAWIVVIDHPYHAITGPDGTFSLDNVPPGTYTLEVWHEQLGAATQTVTVTAGESTAASMELTQRAP